MKAAAKAVADGAAWHRLSLRHTLLLVLLPGMLLVVAAELWLTWRTAVDAAHAAYDRSLLGAYASGKAVADVAIVAKAAADVLGRTAKRAGKARAWSPRARWVAALGLGVLIGAVIVGTASFGWNALQGRVTDTPASQAGR